MEAREDSVPLSLYSVGSFSRMSMGWMVVGAFWSGFVAVGRAFSSCRRKGLRMIGMMVTVDWRRSKIFRGVAERCRDSYGSYAAAANATPPMLAGDPPLLVACTWWMECRRNKGGNTTNKVGRGKEGRDDHRGSRGNVRQEVGRRSKTGTGTGSESGIEIGMTAGAAGPIETTFTSESPQRTRRMEKQVRYDLYVLAPSFTAAATVTQIGFCAGFLRRFRVAARALRNPR